MFRVTIQTDRGVELGRFSLPAPGSARRLLIGRADDCDLRIRHASVSRHHCALALDEDGDWILHDLGSTLGTIVDGQRIVEAAVHDGLIVRLGPAVLRFHAVPAPLPGKPK